MNFNYQNYLKSIKPFLYEYSEYIIINPLSVKDIELIESKLGCELNEIYKEFLLNFGIFQDFINDFSISRTLLFADLGFTKSDYIVISAQEGFLYLMNNKNKEDDIIYKVTDNEEGEYSDIIPAFTLFEKIESEITNLISNQKNRNHNKEKKITIEYQYDSKAYEMMLGKIESFIHLTDWKEMTDEPNFFIPEEAIIELFGYECTVYRHYDKSLYWFTIEEDIMVSMSQSVIQKFESNCQLFKIDVEIKDENISCKKIEILK